MLNKFKKLIGYLKYILGLQKYYLNKKKNWMVPFFHENIVDCVESHTIHYFKWKITKNVSVRYFFIFADREEFKNNFILKDHKNHKSVLLHPRMAIGLINELGKYPEEIYGRKDLNDLDSYRKTIIKHTRKGFFNIYGFKNFREIVETKRTTVNGENNG